jgi:aspartyl-tRNA(Asn)/glutamyl-tRNA(Gln) amidotransferase subunit B
MVLSGVAPPPIPDRHGFEAMASGELEGIVDRLIAEHPDDWAKFVGGENKVMGFFVGQAMKATGGKADGKALSALLNSKRG